MKTSQVTTVTSTPAHPRGNSLVGRKNQTLLTLLRVNTSRRMLDWDEQIDGVLGAYISTRQATKVHPALIHIEAREIESKEEFSAPIGETTGNL